MNVQSEYCGKKEIDLILFSHLIPCCQNFLEEKKYEELGGDTRELLLFEEIMEKRKNERNYQPISNFLQFLITHPANRLLPHLHKYERNPYSTLFTSSFSSFIHHSEKKNFQKNETKNFTKSENNVNFFTNNYSENNFQRNCKENIVNNNNEFQCEKIYFYRWEKILSLMRNIFCHECSNRWENLKLLSKFAIIFFQSRFEISQFIQIYYEIVLLPSKYPLVFQIIFI